ncbi:ABC transporter substrate-binding protein [Indiicoccus explosivorum]|uniref:ABC transporter substrate-binding protein n=1 Tax=Indiicoccus explosivorum TaxID=1917864 RepID=UPI000B453C0B|nr:ABC transporter substrate-binding protein [Indiicoccus explosivorum]
MKKTWKFGMGSALAALLLAGCGDTAEEPETTEEEVTEEEVADEEVAEETPAEEQPEAVAFPLTVTDAAGNEMTIEEEPESIVSLMPSNTEILFELGLGDRVVGVTDFDTYPEEVADIEKVGGVEFNVEKIISLAPDVVLAHESAVATGAAGYQQLRDAGIPVYVVSDATTFDEVYASIEEIGEVTGAAAEADGIITSMQEEVAAIEEQAAEVEEPKDVFVEIAGAPDIYTAGSGTLIDEMIEVINAENVAAELEGWPNVDPEQIVEWNPDVILTTYGAFTPDAVEQVLAREGFGDVTAVAEEAVYDVDGNVVTRPGPRLTEGLELMAEAVYPEVFSE